MKYFVFSDVHGCINELVDSLKINGYDPNNKSHKLLLLGDAFDHNKTGHFKMYEFLKENIENDKLIWLYGNHELYLLNSIKNNKPGKHTIDAIRDIACGLDPSSVNYSDIKCVEVLKKNKVDEFIINNCRHYFELTNYIFTHGFLPYSKSNNKVDPNFRNIPNNKWNYYHYLNGIRLVLEGIKIENKTLVCGHIGAYYGNITKLYPDVEIGSSEFIKIGKKMMKESRVNIDPFKTFYGDGVIGIDSRSYDTHMVNILIIEEE